MRNKILLLVIICFCISCKNEKKELPEEKEKEVISKNSATGKSQGKIPEFLQEKYEKVYNYQDSLDSEVWRQFLGINYIDDETINFYLYTETDPCDVEYYGKALLNKTEGINSEIENESGEMTFSQEEKEYKLSVILDKEKKKARIKYIRKDSLETDCLPMNDAIMKLMK